MTVTCILQAQNYSTSDSLVLIGIDAKCDASDNLNWNMETDPGAWTGVTWSADDPARVTELVIDEFELIDTLQVTVLDRT